MTAELMLWSSTYTPMEALLDRSPAEVLLVKLSDAASTVIVLLGGVGMRNSRPDYRGDEAQVWPGLGARRDRDDGESGVDHHGRGCHLAHGGGS